MISEFPTASRLPTPVRITEQSWPESTIPMVSIFCITYNHERFIRDALGGFLMQETTFPVEIFVHDDASTDGTADILREYQDRYPQLFRLVLQTQNQYSSNGFRFFFEYLAQQRGDFIALCEGDDFWTHRGKLELQYRTLQEWPTCSGAFHQCAVTDNETGHVELLPADDLKPQSQQLGFRDVLTGYPFHTSTMMVKRQVLCQIPSDVERAKVGDKTIQILATQYGPWARCEGVMSVFRRFSNSNFYHWDPRLMLPTFEMALDLDLTNEERNLARRTLAEAYFDAAIWRRSYNDSREARRLLIGALRTDLRGLVRKHGVRDLLKQSVATILNLGKKHSWADESRFAKKRS